MKKDDEEIKLLTDLKDEVIKTRRMIFFIYCQNYYDEYGVFPDVLNEIDPEKLKKASIKLDTDTYDYQKGARQ